MKYKPNYHDVGRLLKSRQVHRPLSLAGGAWLARARILAPRDSGRTAATGRLVHLKSGGPKGDRRTVSVVFGGQAVRYQFGNRRTRATRFMTRAAP